MQVNRGLGSGDKFFGVILAKAGIQLAPGGAKENWTPAFAGVTQVAWLALK